MNIFSIKIQVAKLFFSAYPNRCGFCEGFECTVGMQPYGYGASKSSMLCDTTLNFK